MPSVEIAVTRHQKARIIRFISYLESKLQVEPSAFDRYTKPAFIDRPAMALTSANFGFLEKHDAYLVHLGALAERYVLAFRRKGSDSAPWYPCEL